MIKKINCKVVLPKYLQQEKALDSSYKNRSYFDVELYS